MNRHVTIKEVAKLLDCSTKTVRRKVDKGLIPAIQPGGPGTHMRFDIDDVLRAVKLSSPEVESQVAISDEAVEIAQSQPGKRSGPQPKWQQKLNN